MAIHVQDEDIILDLPVSVPYHGLVGYRGVKFAIFVRLLIGTPTGSCLAGDRFLTIKFFHQRKSTCEDSSGGLEFLDAHGRVSIFLVIFFQVFFFGNKVDQGDRYSTW